MKQLRHKGHVYNVYGPNDFAAPLTSPRSHKRTGELSKMIRLLGGGGKNGPLMEACLHQVEHRHRGGHRHGRQS
jgi:hypothetical protein